MRILVLLVVLLICSIGISSAGVVYSAAHPRVVVTGSGYQNITDVYNDLVGQYNASFVQTDIMNETSPKVWEIKCMFSTHLFSSDYIFYINDTTVDEWKVSEHYGGWGLTGRIDFNNTKIASWNHTSKTYNNWTHSLRTYENISNTEFYGIKTVYFGYTNEIISNKIVENSTIEHAQTAFVVNGNNLTINDFTIKNGHQQYGTGFRTSYINDSIMSNINIINVSHNYPYHTGSYGMQFEGNNNTVHDLFINKTSWSGTNIQGRFNTFYNVTVYNAGHNGFEFQVKDSTAENITVRYSVLNNFFSSIGAEDNAGRAHNITYTNICGSDSASAYNMRLSDVCYDITIDNATFDGAGYALFDSHNITIINSTQTGGSSGVQFSIVNPPLPNENHAFIDSTFTGNSYTNFFFDGGHKIKIINMASPTFVIDSPWDGNFTMNYYINVSTSPNNYVKMTPSSTNTSMMNAFGKLINGVFVNNDGNSYSPNINRENSLIISDYFRSTSLGTEYITWNISAYGNDSTTSGIYEYPDELTGTQTVYTNGTVVHPYGFQKGTVHNVNPNSTWYRSNPNVDNISSITITLDSDSNRNLTSWSITPLNSSIIVSTVTNSSIKISSSDATNQAYINQSGLTPSTSYDLKRDGTMWSTTSSDSNGNISVLYNGGWSEHTFEYKTAWTIPDNTVFVGRLYSTNRLNEINQKNNPIETDEIVQLKFGVI